MKTKLSQITVLPKKPKTNQLHREPMPKVDDIVPQYTIKCPLRIGIPSNKKLNTLHLCFESTWLSHPPEPVLPVQRKCILLYYQSMGKNCVDWLLRQSIQPCNKPNLKCQSSAFIADDYAINWIIPLYLRIPKHTKPCVVQTLHWALLLIPEQE